MHGLGDWRAEHCAPPLNFLAFYQHMLQLTPLLGTRAPALAFSAPAPQQDSHSTNSSNPNSAIQPQQVAAQVCVLNFCFHPCWLTLSKERGVGRRLATLSG